jgi:2-methylcitrate dehydratase PrpD
MSEQRHRPPNPSEPIATFVSTLSFEEIPEPAVRLAERCFADTAGVTLAGAQVGAGAAAAAIADPGETTVLGREETAAMTDAALANGTAGHGLDFDDVSWGMDGHPSVALVAPALAVGERLDATGRELLTAFVAGFETECAIAAPISPSHYERGWHPTSTFGVFGAAAVTASLLECSPEETRHALHIAASMASGLKRNFGSMTKPLHAGQAVRSGVTAAKLADGGFTADSAAIAGDDGFWDLYAGEGGVEPDAGHELGSEWAILTEGVHVKKYPCCYFTHTSIANVIDLVTEHDVEPESVESITVHAAGGAVDALAHDDPETGLEAKFSMPYTVAYGVVNRRVGLAAFEDEHVDDPAVQAVRERVTLELDPDLHYDSHESRLRLETTDGTVYEQVRENPPGTHENPLSIRELRSKYEMCAERALPEADVEASWAALESLREQPSTRELLAHL